MPDRDAWPRLARRPARARQRAPRRRRVWTGAAALATAGIVVLCGCGSGTDPLAAAPAGQPSATTTVPAGTVVVYGARVGWLPSGHVVTADQVHDVTEPTRTAPGEVHHTGQTLYFADSAEVAAVRAAEKPALDGTRRYAISVSRGQVPTIAEWMAEQEDINSKIGREATYEDIAVAGHPATLRHLKLDQSSFAWSVLWGGENADASVRIAGPDRDVVLRIAESVTLGPAPAGPANPDAAAAQIRETARRAFQGSDGLEMLDAVIDPEGLARLAVDKGLSRDPRAGATVSLDRVSDPVFLGPTEAGALVRVAAPGQPARGESPIRFTLTADGWKVTRSGFCAVFYEFRDCPI
ncbi:hypothetical protein I6A84_07520 [Frankia sp. CNm7]|uniref:Low molecular weight antigen MTB12-like C-terminal domain-containing protein n=1 Tax=Frankia nepalensis TaxID=1836974 RepID=A0A937RG29_9ACTN|nr:hypothetical protein [Frankia nepalensis]MBL7495212.1 hypothetical protein [Frankia nepalensis]MBL7515743.1 hypothetical protein [Frankia nepalensis]MBL7517974.1 hypothetical protein [Frankia nepalensis]MBL7628330.1 hypothetical protein [Frankia nepalensis]